MKKINKASMVVFVLAVLIIALVAGYKYFPSFNDSVPEEDRFTTDSMSVIAEIDKKGNWLILDNDGVQVLYNKKMKYSPETDVYIYERDDNIFYCLGENGRTIVNIETGEYEHSISYKGFSNEENAVFDRLDTEKNALPRFALSLTTAAQQTTAAATTVAETSAE